jgi:hypothetical protein
MGVDVTAEIFYGIIGEEYEYSNSCYDKMDELPDRFGCDFTYYGNSYTGGERAICIESTKQTCWLGEIIAIDNLQIEPDWDDKLKKVCEALDIPFETPNWYLTAGQS